MPGYHKRAFFLVLEICCTYSRFAVRPIPPPGVLCGDHGDICKQKHGRNKSGSIAIIPCDNAYIYFMRTIKDTIYLNNALYMSVRWLTVIGEMVVNNGNVSGGVRCSWG